MINISNIEEDILKSVEENLTDSEFYKNKLKNWINLYIKPLIKEEINKNEEIKKIISNISVDKFPNKDRAKIGLERYYKNNNNIELEYLGFSEFIQSAFVNENAWLIDTGSFRNVNDVLISRIAEKIQAHPKIWKKYFVVR